MKEFESPAASIEEDRPTCRSHPSRLGENRCVDCGGTFCSECGFDWEGDFLCRSCISAYRVETPAQPEQTVTENPPEYADPRRTFSPRTVLRIVLSPGKFFSHMPRGRGMSETIVFAFFWGIVLFTLAIPSFYVTAYTIFSIPELREIYETALSEVRKARGGSGAVSSVEGLPNHREESVISDPSSGTAGEGEIVEKESLGLVGLRRTLILIISFPMGIIPLFVLMALLQHMMLKLMGYPSRFETTARIGLFATAGIAAAIPPIPILAVLFGFVIYPIALTAIGLRQVYGTGVFKATFLTVTSMILANQMMLQLTAFLQ